MRFSHLKDQLEALVTQLVDRGILLEEALTEFEKRFIKAAIDHAKGNQCRAARLLGIHRNTLSRKIEKLRLDHRNSRKK